VRPRSFLLLALVSGAVVLIAVETVTPGTCAQGSPPWPPTSFTVVTDIFGPLSVLAIFASIFTWNRKQRGREGLTCFALALIGACVWGGIGFFVVAWLLVAKSGCLS
jgi:hypothetical protein